jgi:hypothetical protein
MAMRIDISVGYLSQIDRPVPAPVLMTLTREFPADWAASTPPRHRYLPIPTGNSSSTPASRAKPPSSRPRTNSRASSSTA